MRARAAAVVGVVVFMALNPLAAARSVQPAVTVLTISAPASTVFTERIVIEARLSTADGAALRDAPLVLLLDSVEEQRRRTDAEGAATFSVSRDIKPGSHVFTVRFEGDGRHPAATQSVTLIVEAATLRLRTLPPIPGAIFEFRGQRFTTGVDGLAVVQLETPPSPEEVPTFISAPSVTGRRIDFGKWWGNAPDLTAGFDLYYLVSLQFANRLGSAVDPATIDTVTLRSSIGEIIELPRIEPIWVHGMRVVSLAGGLEAKDILYGVDDVEIKGANVVNRAQQRFAPRESRSWNVELLFYQTSIELRDLIFGFPISATIRLEYPNGDVLRVQTDSRGIVELPALPRGTYQVTPERVGVTVTQALAMSRDADTHLTVISYLDVAVGLTIPIGIAVGLLLVGRPHLIWRLRGLPRRLWQVVK